MAKLTATAGVGWSGVRVAGSDVIADVSGMLLARIDAALSGLVPAPGPATLVDDLAVDVAAETPRMTLFLYEVAQDAVSRRPPPACPSSPGRPARRT